MPTRRGFTKLTLLPFVAAGGVMAVGCRVAAAQDRLAKLEDAFAKLETESGGRLGVSVLDTESGALIGHRADERFPMCSTFKLLAVSALLAEVDAGRQQLATRIRIEPQDVLSYAPVTKQHVGAEGMSLAELCDAAIAWSDNTAANLILSRLGGPAAVTRYARRLGDELTRLDRNEPDLNEATPGDPRDTTTPAAMASNLKALAVGSSLSAPSREQLVTWLVGCKTGDARLRAGLPKGWRVGDKTGSGNHGSTNDVAVVWPEGHAPIVIAVYLTETAAQDDKRNVTHASIGRAVAAAIGMP
jgi:beta-lactamase class A